MSKISCKLLDWLNDKFKLNSKQTEMITINQKILWKSFKVEIHV